MQLAIALAIIASVLLRNHEAVPIEQSFSIRVACSILVGVVPVLFVRSFARTILTNSIPTSRFVRSLARFERSFLVVWIAATAILLAIFRWDLCVCSTWPCNRSTLLAQFVELVPILFPVIVFWWYVSDLEYRHTAGYEVDPCNEPRWRENLAAVSVQIRQMILVPAIPVIAILTMDDATSWLQVDNGYRAILFGSLVLSLPFILPSVLRHLWKLQSLNQSKKRDRIHAMISRMGVSVADICLWKTRNRCINAAIAGSFRRSRILLLTDALLDTFSESDLDAVVAHEMAHVKLRHVPTMLLSLVAAGLTAIMCGQIIDESVKASVSRGPDSLLIFFPILACWLLLHRFIARTFEHEADLLAVEHLDGHRDSHPKNSETREPFPRTTHDAVHHYVDMLQKLAPFGTTGSDWWHPSIACRIRTLERICQNDEQRELFEVRTTAINRMVRGSVVFLLLVTTGLGLLSV